ncbi:hypothetical protein ACTFIZ_007121 [Dictyostelium cf. discoideum]
MKYFAVLFIIIFTLAFAYGCDEPCGADEVSVAIMGECFCSEREYFPDVTISVFKYSEKDIAGTHNAQYKVTLSNRRDTEASHVSLTLSSNIIINGFQVSREDNRITIPRIEGNNAFTFGFTSIGRDEPKILLKSSPTEITQKSSATGIWQDLYPHCCELCKNSYII